LLHEEEEEIYLPRTITILNKKNTILMLARNRLPEKQKPSMLAAHVKNISTMDSWQRKDDYWWSTSYVLA